MSVDENRLDRMARMVARCDDFLSAEGRARSAEDPREIASARADAVRSILALLGDADCNGVLSEHYLATAAPENHPKRAAAAGAARFLLDLGGSQGALEDGAALGRMLGAMGAYWADMLRGAKPDDLFAQVKHGSGNRPKSSSQRGAQTEFVRLVYYTSARRGMSLPEAFATLRPSGSYEGFRKATKYLAPRKRNLAKNAGGLAKLGGALPPELADVHRRCLHFLEDEDRLADLIARGRWQE